MAQILLSLGSNIDRETNLRAAVRALREAFGDLALSPVYETPAEGFEGPPFLNLAAACASELAPADIVQRLKAIEDQLGRSRLGAKFSSRSIDIDLLTYGDQCIEQPGLSLPRDEILRYAFVLKPLVDLVGEQCYPGSTRSYRTLWQAFSGARLLRPVKLDWDV